MASHAYRENPPMASVVIGGHRHMHRQADLTSLLSFLNEIRLKSKEILVIK
jgi:hypothetical protein